MYFGVVEGVGAVYVCVNSYGLNLFIWHSIRSKSEFCERKKGKSIHSF